MKKNRDKILKIFSKKKHFKNNLLYMEQQNEKENEN
jgi:hypothetical protein